MRGPARPLPVGSRIIDALLWLIAVASLGATLALSLGPRPAVLQSFTYADKVFHGLAYAAMTLAWLLAAAWRPGRRGRASIARAVVLVGSFVVLGTAIELVQFWFDRTADVLDAVANSVGVAGGWGMWSGLRLAVSGRAGGRQAT